MATSEKIKEEVTKLVESALRDKYVAGIESDINTALQKAEQTISLLSDKLTALEKTTLDSVAVLEALETKNDELSTEIAAKSEELTRLVEENKSLTERASSAEAELDNIKKDVLVKDRMAVLESLKIARSGDARDKQLAKLRDMSDEDFAAYKDDLQALRAEFLASAAPAQAAQEQNDAGAETDASVEGEEDAATAEDASATDGGTPPADVNSALNESSTTLVNAETASVGDKWVEYRNRFSIGLTKLIEKNRGTETEKR